MSSCFRCGWRIASRLRVLKGKCSRDSKSFISKWDLCENITKFWHFKQNFCRVITIAIVSNLSRFRKNTFNYVTAYYYLCIKNIDILDLSRFKIVLDIIFEVKNKRYLKVGKILLITWYLNPQQNDFIYRKDL